MTDVNDTIETTDEEQSGRSSRRAILGLTGAGIAGAVVMGPKIAEAADNNPVLVGNPDNVTDDGATVITNTNAGSPTPGSPGQEAVKGVLPGTANGSHAILGVTEGTGHAIAGVVNNTDNVVGATWGRHFGQGAAIEGDSKTETSPLAGPANAVKGVIGSETNGSHAILGITQGFGHAIAGVIGNETDLAPQNTVAATWGLHYGEGAAVEGDNRNTTAPLAGNANAVKGIIKSETNGSHAILGITQGFGHAVAGVIGSATDPATQNTVAATWGLHYGEGAAVEGDSRNETAELAGPANAVLGTVKSTSNGSHAVKGVTFGAGHSVAGDTPADAEDGSGGPNTTAATWGRHGGIGAGIGGVSAEGYGGEFIGGKAHVRLIQTDDAPVGAPTGDDHQLGELYVDGEGNLYLNKADGLNFTKLNDQTGAPQVGTIRMLDEPMRAYDSRPDYLPAGSQKGKTSENEIREIDLTTETDFPAGSSGALLNITVTETESDFGGYLTVYGADLDETPNTSTVNWFAPGQTFANGATINTGPDGKVKVFARRSTHFIVDVTGYVI